MQERLPTFSRIAELKQEIAAIANVPKASSETALLAATKLVASYPGQQGSDPVVAKEYMRQIVNLCTGVDLDVLAVMIDVTISTSLVRKEPTFLPTAAKVAEWIDWKMDPKRSRIGWYLDEIKSIEERETEEKVSPEERARRADMLRKVSQVIKDTAKAAQRASSTLGLLPQVERTMEEREASIAEMQNGVK